VRALHDGLRRLGLQPVGAPFPIVPVHTPGLDATRLARRLREHGVRALVLAPACRPVPTLTFLLTADHSVHDVRSALAAVAAVVERERVAA
jgi:7-keto-8-aminopelargonate synthetase-like enzyme